MSTYVTITGNDLDYFKSIVSQGISGNFGNLTEVRIAVNAESGVMIGANGYTSEYMGKVEQSDPETPDQPERLDSLINRIGELLPQLERIAQSEPAG